jgi:hypothetical protein
MEKMSDELRPCPFCGNIPSFNPVTKEVACIRYHKLAIGTYTAKEWNTRPIEDALRKQLDIAVEALRYYRSANLMDDQGEYDYGVALNALAEIEKVGNASLPTDSDE